MRAKDRALWALLIVLIIAAIAFTLILGADTLGVDWRPFRLEP